MTTPLVTQYVLQPAPSQFMSSKLKVDTRVTVETPEGVDFQFMVAGPGKRSISFLLDTLLKFGVIAIAFFIFLLVVGVTAGGSGVGMGMVLIIWFCMSWMYGSCFEAFWNGQTPGKKSQSLRVVRTNGTPIGWFEAFGRNLLLVADGMLVLGPLQLNTVGLLTMSSNRRMQRLGDLFFDTMVIDESREFISRTPGLIHGLEKIPRSHCTGRYYVPERTLAVIERLFEGDRLISDGRREEIARNLAVVLHKRLGFEEPGPDPTNPNSYFVQTPIKHTVFLKRILKTFAEDPDGEGIEDGEEVVEEIPTLESLAKKWNRDTDRFGDLDKANVAPAASTAVLPTSVEAPDFSGIDALVDDAENKNNKQLPPDWRTS